MEEIASLHNLNIEWGCITNLLDKIISIEDKIDGGWPEMIDMVADAMTKEGESKASPASLFFDLYSFMFRLYYRLKSNPEKRPFNEAIKIEVMGEEYFRVQNYDYDMYKWIRSIGCGSTVSNGYMDVPIKKLNDKQRRAFERKASKGVKNDF